jgi:hypothetical protein
MSETEGSNYILHIEEHVRKLESELGRLKEAQKQKDKIFDYTPAWPGDSIAKKTQK